ncbi:MAG: hypothetical protein ACLQNE_08550 [Thermoguttaceae bacterium]
MILRLSPYVHCRSLWFDEALLALNLVDRGYAHLTAPLDYHQAAPLAFLWAERAIISLSHTNEYTLRLLPFMAGVAVLPLCFLLARQYVNPLGALLALTIVSLCPYLIYYSNEVKQYSLDVLISTMLILYSATMVDAPLRRRGMIALALCGSVSLWLSHPSVFVLGGIGAALFISRLLKGRTTDVIYLALIGASWLCSFSVLYFVSLRFIAGDHAFRSFWSDGMLPSPIGFRGACRWMCDVACKSFHDPLGFTAAAVPGALAVIGCADVARRNVGKCLILLLPVVLVAFAAMLRLYPFLGRLILFIVPIYSVFIGAGVSWMCKGMSPFRVAACVVMFLYIVVFPGGKKALGEALQPGGKEEARSGIEMISQNAAPGDILYVYHGAVPPFEFYRGLISTTNVEVIRGVNARQHPEEYVTDIEHIRGRRRVWSLFAHVVPELAIDEEEFILKLLDTRGRRLAKFDFTGARVYLHEFQSDDCAGSLTQRAVP